MRQEIGKPVRRFAAVSLLLAGIAAAALFVVLPFFERMGDLDGAIVTEREMLGRLTAIANNEDLTAKAGARAEELKQAGIFIEGESESIRLAALQSQLANIIAENGIKARSTRGLPQQERHNLKLVGAQLQIVAPIATLQKILLDIEAHRPVLLVDLLQVTPASMTGVSTDDPSAGMLDARFDVYAIEGQKG